MTFAYTDSEGSERVLDSDPFYELRAPLPGPVIEAPDRSRTFQLTYTEATALPVFDRGACFEFAGAIYKVTDVTKPEEGSPEADLGMVTYDIEFVQERGR